MAPLLSRQGTGKPTKLPELLWPKVSLDLLDFTQKIASGQRNGAQIPWNGDWHFEQKCNSLLEFPLWIFGGAEDSRAASRILGAQLSDSFLVCWLELTQVMNHPVG